MALFRLGVRAFIGVLFFSSCLAMADSPVAGFPVRWDEEKVPFSVGAVYTLPDQEVTIEVGDDTKSDDRFVIEGIEVEAHDGGKWTWQAPSEPDRYPFTIKDKESGEEVQLNAFVLVPYTDVKKGTAVHKYLGEYPTGHPGF